MRAYATIFGRGFLIVFLTALNVRQISLLHYGPAFAVGCGISLVWWHNAHTAAHNDLPGAKWAYVVGAGCGTVCGMWAGS